MSNCCNPTFTVPTYNITGGKPGLSESELTATAQYISSTFNIPLKDIRTDNGVLSYIDPVAYGALPMVSVPSRDIPTIYKAGEETQSVYDALVIAKLRDIKVMAPERALTYCAEIIKRLNLDNSSMKMTLKTTNTKFQLVFAKGLDGNPIEYGTFDIDTKIVGRFTINGTPVEGAGAKFIVNFNETKPTNIHIAMSKYDNNSNNTINILTPSDAIKEYYPVNSILTQSRTNGKLVYYAPDYVLSNGQAGTTSVTEILPSYLVGGEYINNKGQVTNLLEKFIPAYNNYSNFGYSNIKTTAILNKDNTYTINITGTVVSQKPLLWISVSSGPNQEGINFITDTDGNWVPGTNSNGLSVAKISDTQFSVRYTFICSQSTFRNETTVLLCSNLIGHDVNDKELSANDTVTLTFPTQIAPKTAGTNDYGIEHSISDGLGNDLVRRYRDKMNEYSTKSYQFGSSGTWENDWKVQANYDAFVGNTDEAFYCGHGNPNGFSFETNQSDTWLNYDDVPTGLWGGKDLDWVVLVSCQVLNETNSSGLQWYNRWGGVFGGLHLICGFHTNAADDSGFGRKFAMYQGARDGKSATPIRSAWVKANDEDQPADRVCAVMGVCGGTPNSQTTNYNGQVVQNYNDYYHGKGTGAGPDIPRSAITCFWRVSSTS